MSNDALSSGVAGSPAGFGPASAGSIPASTTTPAPNGKSTPEERAARREVKRAANRTAWRATKGLPPLPADAALLGAVPEPVAPAPAEPDEPVEDPDDDGPLKTHEDLEKEARRLYQRSLKNLETILRDPRATNQDRLAAAQHLRLAASIGQSDPAPTVYVLPMQSLLGADAPDQPAPDIPKEPKP